MFTMPVPYPKEFRDDVITELYSQGSSVRTIGAQYGVDPSTVAKRMKRAGVKLRPRRGFA